MERCSELPLAISTTIDEHANLATASFAIGSTNILPNKSLAEKPNVIQDSHGLEANRYTSVLKLRLRKDKYGGGQNGFFGVVRYRFDLRW